MRETCADWIKGAEPRDDPILKGKKDPDDGYNIKVPRRNVGPSSTQVFVTWLPRHLCVAVMNLIVLKISKILIAILVIIVL